MIPRSWWYTAIGGVFMSALLPVAGNWLRGDRAPGCAMDGGAIKPTMRTRIVDSESVEFVFCSISCAERWLSANHKQPREAYVTDEVSGQEIKADEGHYVRSGLVIDAATGERRHVFRDANKAEEFARAFRGRVLQGSERPFARNVEDREKNEARLSHVTEVFVLNSPGM